jgi:hypothetical protein
MASLQASDEFLNSLQSSACSSPYLQPSHGVSQLTLNLLAAEQAADERSCGFRTIETQIERDDYMVKAGRSFSRQYKNNQLSEEALAKVLRDSQESPILGVSASLAYGFNKDLRMDSPTFKSLKEKYNSPSSSPELREACKRRMKLILNN